MKDDLMELHKKLSELDLSCAVAKASSEFKWTRPELSQDSSLIHIENGRHPVLQSTLSQDAKDCISNSFKSNSKSGKCAIITGANMGGKSTFLRQNALIVLMAHCGLFVPASSARISLAAAIYSRVGSVDNLARNQSSFKVEMDELSVILKNCTEKSLVLIDELGRGTSYEDGYAISKASLDHLLHQNSHVLFATHYHKLAEDFQDNSKVKLLQTVIEKSEGSLIFTHKIAEGVSLDSHGIDVAQSSGLPADVIKMAVVIKNKLLKF